ncbi:MAG: chemotaxis protein CheA [Syntrophaceticus sp.]|nr:chemotaxis protein CheA [Syntrophaceticus sp.]
MINEERRELIDCFVSESRDLLDEIEPQIIELEQIVATAGRIDKRLLNDIFRLFHTQKGSASFLDLQAIIQVTHQAETLFDLFRSGRAMITSVHVDLFCQAADFIRGVLEQVEREGHDNGFEGDAQQIVDALVEAIRSVSFDGEPVQDEQALSGNDEEIYRGEQAPEGIEITAELIKSFVDEALELCEGAESAALSLENSADADSARKAFRAFHNLKGNAALLGLPGIEKVSHLAESILDSIISGERECDGVVITVLLTLIDSLRNGVRRVQEGKSPELPDLEQLLQFVQQAIDLPDLDFETGETSAEKGEDEENSSIQVQGTDSPSAARADHYSERVQSRSQFIKVDTIKLDQLLDLVGELVIAEAMVASEDEEQSGKAVRQLNKVTREIQEIALSLRMVPLTTTFRKMVRLVRDLAKKENKQVELEIRGAETEVDKTVIEQISDPLVHLLRNAVDHGIGDPAERRAAGKPEVGRVLIEARHSAGEVWVIVQDDGKGLDRVKIMERGLEKGLITEEEAEILQDEDIWQMIFAPGFSTAKEISDISGRGVGMDVVKNNVEKLNGRIEVHSTQGRGTTFIIHIPLTLAIIEGMIIKVGSARYTIPIGSIKESFKPRPSMITRTPDGLEIVQLRGELLPVLRLHELYQVENNCQELSEGILIAVQNNDRKCCIFVDQLLGQQQIVIKGLPDYLGHICGISGCAILSDGSVSLILDIADLLETVQG